MFDGLRSICTARIERDGGSLTIDVLANRITTGPLEARETMAFAEAIGRQDR